MEFEVHQIREAYKKLRAYIYYDNTDILLRQKLVEFETNTTKDLFSSFYPSIEEPYKELKVEDVLEESSKKVTVDQKLEMITKAINEFDKNPDFMNHFLEKISVTIYPKKLKKSKIEKENCNFISNRRVEKQYEVTRLTAFINAPIELHIVSVLWIMENGVYIDAKLKEECLGNRLVLTHDKDKVVQGSSLFKPYFKQYQKWRDESVQVAQNFLTADKDVLFVNLDIQDYFHSVRIPVEKIYKNDNERRPAFQPSLNLQKLLLEIHLKYTELVGNRFQIPFNFYDELKDNTGNVKQVILPIGLLSSYILANDYLNEFDDNVLKDLKPIYYGRYVDDILLVIANPKECVTRQIEEFSNGEEEQNKEGQDFQESKINILELILSANLSPLIKLVDSPNHIIYEEENGGSKRAFRIEGYPSLYCQSDKSLAYFFDHEESDLVMDKLKKELNEKTSEFRDFPDEGEDDEAFEESAYYLLYDGTDGKIKTLKDYKENRFGLTIFLANKIFSALRHEKIISEEESTKIIKFFRGRNALEFCRLWEKIFTFFLANNQPKAYVEFYLHCLEQIDKVHLTGSKTQVKVDQLKTTLIEYLDCANEIVLSINPSFIKKSKKVIRHFEFQLKKHENNLPIFFRLSFEFTKPGSFWLTRFRQTNMIRHHYLIHPLLSYTELSKNSYEDLSKRNFQIEKFKLDSDLIDDSPRPVKFWECCLATLFQTLSQHRRKNCTVEDDKILVDYFAIKEEQSAIDPFEMQSDFNKFYLEDAFDLFKRINKPHIPSYRLDDKDFKDNYFILNFPNEKSDFGKNVRLQEITVHSNLENKLKNPTIAFANTEVKEHNIQSALQHEPNLSFDRYQTFSTILKKARKEKSEILLFPEFFIPVDLVSSIVRYSEKNQVLVVTGLEHILVDKTAFNFIITVLPVEVDGIKDAVVVFRLKNHYAPLEELLITGNHLNVPKPLEYRYEIFNWRNIYFSNFYCFELADVFHRSVVKGKIDLLVGIEWNMDTPYFSNIVESTSRDLHSYVAQVNTSQFGDSRLTQPGESAKRDILRLKGGEYDTILVAKINISELREFQRKKYSLTRTSKEYKPLPPDFPVQDVISRINNLSLFSKLKER